MPLAPHAPDAAPEPGPDLMSHDPVAHDPASPDPERDAAILAVLPLVPEHGWTFAALRRAAGPDADLMFPGGPAEMVEAHSELGDRLMQRAAVQAGLTGLRLSARVRAIVAIRLRQNRAHKAAIGRGLALLALPGQARRGARSVARTVDAIWHAAGDWSADFNWYTKRGILAGVYGATLLYWLRDDSPEDEASLAFLDRRLAGVARFGALKRRLSNL